MNKIPDGILKNLDEPSAGSAYKGSGERKVNDLETEKTVVNSNVDITKSAAVQNDNVFKSWHH